MYIRSSYVKYFYIVDLASQNSFTVVSGDGKKKITSFGSGIAGGDYLSSNLETNLSKGNRCTSYSLSKRLMYVYT